MTTESEAKINVCTECSCASCWQGHYLCSEPSSVRGESTQKTIAELARLDLEHPRFWIPDPPEA